MDYLTHGCSPYIELYNKVNLKKSRTQQRWGAGGVPTFELSQ